MISLNLLMQDKSYPESGSLLYDIIYQSIQNDQTIDIDMTGVVSLPSMFLNATFGKAFSQFGVDSIKQKTKFFHISRSQAERISEYFSRQGS
ncbi:MAG: STAS-like domain-containing protein [Bacteroidales bacterium]|nr:STAS-like domain-containing protein [Candidatus Colimorpha onthohippi]